jgi:hypothetical protein
MSFAKVFLVLLVASAAADADFTDDCQLTDESIAQLKLWFQGKKTAKDINAVCKMGKLGEEIGAVVGGIGGGYAADKLAGGAAEKFGENVAEFVMDELADAVGIGGDGWLRHGVTWLMGKGARAGVVKAGAKLGGIAGGKAGELLMGTIASLIELTEGDSNKSQRDFTVFECRDMLDITSNDTVADIKKAYRKKSVRYHPDKGGSQKQFLKLSACKEILIIEYQARHDEL